MSACRCHTATCQDHANHREIDVRLPCNSIQAVLAVHAFMQKQSAWYGANSANSGRAIDQPPQLQRWANQLQPTALMLLDGGVMTCSTCYLLTTKRRKLNGTAQEEGYK